MKRLLFSVLIIATSFASGQTDSAINGPVTGFVVDGRRRAIRPIEGIPGAARLGGAIAFPFPVQLAAISSAQDYALATAPDDDGLPVLARGLRSGAPQTAAIEGAIAPAGIVISDSGGAAALYSNARLQFVTGLPAAPRASDPIDISAIEGGVVALALDNPGRNALVAGGAGGVYWAGAGGVKRIAQVPGASAAALLPGGDDGVVGSGETGDIVLLRGLSGSLNLRTVGGAFNGVASVRALAAMNAQEIAVADGMGRLMTIDLESGSAQAMPLAGSAERFERVDRNLLLLNRPGPHPLLLLDSGGEGHATYFVPPERGVGMRRK
jgi:hypothetical protein